MVELDLIALGQAWPISPDPSYRDTRVVEIANIVVRDLVIAATADPDTDTAGEETPTGTDNIVVHHNMMGPVRLDRSIFAYPDPRSACAQILHQGPLQPALHAASAEPDPIETHVRDFAILDRQMIRI